MKKGDIVKLINNEGIVVPLGTRAIIISTSENSDFVDIHWLDNKEEIDNGIFFKCRFELIKSEEKLYQIMSCMPSFMTLEEAEKKVEEYGYDSVYIVKAVKKYTRELVVKDLEC